MPDSPAPNPEFLTHERLGKIVVCSFILLCLFWFIRHQIDKPPEPYVSQEERQANIDYSVGKQMAIEGRYILIPPSVSKTPQSEAYMRGFLAGVAENRSHR
jgi:hypothetical protein